MITARKTSSALLAFAGDDYDIDNDEELGEEEEGEDSETWGEDEDEDQADGEEDGWREGDEEKF